MKIRINGELKDLVQSVSVQELLEGLSVRKEAVVCELNHEIIDKNSYQKIYLNDNDSLEIVHFVGGG